MIDTVSTKHKLVITVVNKGQGSKVVQASKRMGCEGGTILPGRGTSLKEESSFWAISFDPEKEIVFSVTSEENAPKILNAISKATKLGKPGNGVAFIVNIKSLTGIAHLLES